MEEIWKDVIGFEELYQVSNIGRVKRKSTTRYVYGCKSDNPIPFFSKERICTLEENEDGYYKVALSKNSKSKRYFVHRLVAEAFLSKTDENLEVNHIDGNKHNNCVDNLEWVSHKQNMEHCFSMGLRKITAKNMLGKTGDKHPSSKAVLKYDKNNVFIREYGSIAEAARENNIDSSGISRCCKGKWATSGGYIWKYKNTRNKEI